MKKGAAVYRVGRADKLQIVFHVLLTLLAAAFAFLIVKAKL